MKIVQINHIFMDGGGMEEHIYRISREFVRKGHQVKIITTDYLPTGEETIGKRARKEKGIQIETLKGMPTNFPPGRIQMPDLIDRLMKIDCDVIHSHGTGINVGEQAIYVAKVRGIPFVYTPHFHPYWSYSRLQAQKIWEVLQPTLGNMIVSNADACIAVSDPQKDDIIKYANIGKQNSKKIRVIPNGVELDTSLTNDKKKKEEIFKKYEIPQEDHYMVFLGDVTNPRKGAYEAVQAFREVRKTIPNTHLIMIGPWGERLKLAYGSFQLINKMAKARYVTATGYVSEEDKAILLAAGDLLISPTAFEAFGIALAEAMYCGTPVVATNVGGIPYVVREGKDGFLVDGQDNIKGFAEACVKLLKDPRMAKEMGRNGRDRVRRKFRWDKTGEALLDLYKGLIEKK